MAFNVNELNVIRTYVAVTGEAPTQDQLAAAFNYSSLNALARDLTQGNTQSNEDFVKAMYTNLLGREADAEGLEYWVSLMSASQGLNALSKAAAATAFQWTAAANAESEAGLVDGTAGLSPVGGAFPTGNDNEEPGTGEPGAEYQDTFTFDTEVGRSDVSGWTHAKGDSNEAGVGVDSETEDNPGRADYESKTHKIFNVGKEAMDKGVSTISADYTFEIKDQLGSQGKYEAYFLSPILDNTVTNLGAVLTLEIIDRMAEANNKADALSLVAIESFSFYLNGEQKVISSQGILNATTYEELRDAIAAELTAQGLSNISVALGSEFSRQQVDPDTLVTTGNNVVGDQIVLTASGNSIIERGGFAFGERAGVDRNVDPSGRQDTSALGSSSSLISTNLVLENIGYGSKGGSINISGQSDSNKGVQQFDIEAKRGTLDTGVWLSELSSNPLKANWNALEVVNVTGNAKYFNVEKLTDVRDFNASQFGGDVKLNASVTHNVIARDLNLVDTANNPAADNQNFSYNLGNGTNSLNLTVSQEAVSHEDFALNIRSGSGADTVTLELVPTNNNLLTDNWYANQSALKNISINTGAGNDTIWTKGSGDVYINAGAGNDTVYTDNSATQNIAGRETKATWVVNATNPNINDIQGAGAGAPALLYKAQLTVTLAGANAANAGGVTAAQAEAGVNGFESTVTIPTTMGGGYYGNQANINQAIKAAINSDPVLSKLLIAKDGPNHSVVIESRIDGQFNANDLVITIDAADIEDFSNSELTGIKAAMEQMARDSDLDPNDAAVQTALDNAVTNQDSPFATDGVNYQAPEAKVDVLDFTTLTNTAAGGTGGMTVTVTVAGDVYTATLADGGDVAGADFATALATAFGAPGDFVNAGGDDLSDILGLTLVNNAGVVTITYPVGVQNNASVAVTNANPASPVVFEPRDASEEVQTLDLSGLGNVTASGNFLVGGLVVAVTAGQTPAQVAAAIAAALDTNTLTSPVTGEPVVAEVVGADNDSVEITFDVADGNVSNVAIQAGSATFENGLSAITVEAVDYQDITQVSLDDIDTSDSEAFVPAVGTPGDVAGPVSGANSNAHTDNVINLGAGNDVLVLSTSANANETIEITGYNNGQNTIVNFSDSGAGIDQLDLSAYLTSMTSASGSSVSQQRVDVSVNTFNANSVINFNGFNFDEDDTWDGLTAATLLSAIKDNTTEYAGVNNLVGNLAVVDDLVGNSRKHVLFVENDENAGEYKVFELTSTQATNGDLDFSGVQLIGTFDFGNSINITDAILV